MEFPGLFFFKSLVRIENVRARVGGGVPHLLLFLLKHQLAIILHYFGVLLTKATQNTGILKAGNNSILACPQLLNPMLART